LSNYQEAKKAYLKCSELCGGTDNGAVRTIQADALMDSAFCDHKLYYANQGQPPDVQVALAAQKEQIEAARTMGWTDDVNDVERQRRALERIADYYCDNGKHAEALKYSDDAIAGANKNHATQLSTAVTHVTKARVLAGLGKNDEADKEFRQAVKIADAAYGAGSDASELCIRHYAAGLIRDGQTEHGEKIRQMQDDFTVW
jgi:tetratricopeptide (TPR) repeat protein